MINKAVKILACITILILFSAIVPLAFSMDWSPPMRLTWNSSEDWMPSIMKSNDGNMWVFWHSKRTGDEELFYKTYNSSQTHPWSEEMRLTNHPSVDAAPFVVQTFDNRTCVVWMTNRTGNYDIFYKIYDGSSWSNDKQLTNDTRRDELPSIVEAYGKIWVFWDSKRGTNNYDLYYKTTTDGEIWSADSLLSLSSPTLDDWDPAVMRATDGKIWLTWTRSDDIYYSVYDGVSWSSANSVVKGGYEDWHPSIMQANNNTIWVTWDCGRTDPPVQTDIFYSIYDGVSWSSATQLTTHLDEDLMPSIAQDTDGIIWITWVSNRSDDNDIFYVTSSIPQAHDVEIFSVIPSNTKVFPGDSVSIEVVARNHGTNNETIQVNCFVDDGLIGTKTVNVTVGELFPLSFVWSTVGYALGDHIVSANASLVPGETNIVDNTYVDGVVKIVKLPEASFNYTPGYPEPNELVTFDASNSTPDGGTIVSYRWDFGDGNITTVVNPIITHVYTLEGAYNVFLTITDSEGLNDTAWRDVPVHVHDVAVIGGSYTAKSPWGVGLSYFVDVANQGTTAEIFYVSIFFGETSVGTTEVFLFPGETLYSVEIFCDTTLVSPSSYTVMARADVVLGERDTTDNNMDLGSLWLYVLDLAIVGISPSMTKAYVGNIVNVTVTLENEGTMDAHANLKFYYNNTLVEQKDVFLSYGMLHNFTFLWNTADVAVGVYMLEAVVVATEEGFIELDTLDNEFQDGVVQIKIPGDVNGDRMVDTLDLNALMVAYGSSLGSSNWDSDCDINGDKIVNSYDLNALARNFGKTIP